MKDLKHLSYFEDLLQDANNELVIQARGEGKKCVAYVCENTPEPLLNLEGCFSARLRAPRTSSMEMATYYLTSFLCEYSRALLERAMEGGFNFADCLIAPDGCSMINRCVENMELLHTMDQGKENFFYENMEIPMKADDNGLNLYVLQCKNHILKPLQERFGIDVSDAAIRKSVAEHNRVCELIRAIGEFRKGDKPTITGYEFSVITLATYAAPKYLIMDKLEATLEELKTSLAYETASDAERDYAAAFAAFPRIRWQGHCMYCGHCAPCPKGIDVAAVTKFLNLCRAHPLRMPRLFLRRIEPTRRRRATHAAAHRRRKHGKFIIATHL